MDRQKYRWIDRKLDKKERKINRQIERKNKRKKGIQIYKCIDDIKYIKFMTKSITFNATQITLRVCKP